MDEARKRDADKREAKNRRMEKMKEERKRREEDKIAIEKLEKRYNDLTHRVSHLEEDQVEQLEKRYNLEIAYKAAMETKDKKIDIPRR